MEKARAELSLATNEIWHLKSDQQHLQAKLAMLAEQERVHMETNAWDIERARLEKMLDVERKQRTTVEGELVALRVKLIKNEGELAALRIQSGEELAALVTPSADLGSAGASSVCVSAGVCASV